MEPHRGWRPPKRVVASTASASSAAPASASPMSHPGFVSRDVVEHDHMTAPTAPSASVLLPGALREHASHTAPVAHVHFARFVLARAPTAAGDTLISAGNDGCVVLWNCAHGAEPPVLLRKIAHGAKPNWVATSSVDCCAGGEGGGGGGWGRVYVADTSSDITVYDVPLA